MVQKEPQGAARPRGRPRSFDPDAVLDKARAVFWNLGYAATSLDDLAAATGLNRPSLYAAFGDKHALYLAALERSRAEATAALGAALSSEAPLRAVLTENGAILQYLADRRPASKLAPDGFARYQLQQWLSFIGSELHKWVFTPLLSPTHPAEGKAKAKEAAAERLAYLNDHLTGRDWLLDDFSVADAYLAAVLNWNQAVKLDFSVYPAIQAYQARLMTRPAVQKAVQEEFALFQPA